MKLFRFIFDSFSFVIPIYFPKILYIYLLIHLFYPQLVYLPKKLDNIENKLNIKILK